MNKETKPDNATNETRDGSTETILRGNKCVVIDTFREGFVTARLYVNARTNLAFNGTPTQVRWKGKTIHAARVWAQKQLN